MKWNIFFTLQGAGGEMEVPNTTNPIEAVDFKAVLAAVLAVLHGAELPGNNLVSIVGIRIKKES